MIVTKKKSNSLGEISLPHDLELERAILGALILESDAMDSLEGINLKSDHFFDEKNKRVFKAIEDLFKEGKKIDLLTVRSMMAQNGSKTKKEDGMYLADLTNNIASALHVRDHAMQVLDLSMRRETKLLGERLSSAASNSRKALAETIIDFVNTAFAITDSPFTNNEVAFHIAIKSHLSNLENKQKNGELTGLSTGLSQLDSMIGGWKEGDVSIVGGRPGMGKTSLLLKFFLEAGFHLLQKGEGSAAFFSCEMSREQLLNRVLSQKTNIVNDRLRDARLDEKDWMKIFKESGDLSNLPLFIEDTPNIGIDELKVKARRMAKKDNLKILFIDYLQLMSPSLSSGRYRTEGNRNQEVSDLSRQIKGLSRELNIPIIIASQLSRAVETRSASKIPQLSDLRESGTIEQDASNVIFIHRPEYYGITQDENGNPCEGLANLILAKHRHGATGVVPVRFDGAKTLFTDY